MGDYWTDRSRTSSRPATKLKQRHLDEIGNLMPVSERNAASDAPETANASSLEPPAPAHDAIATIRTAVARKLADIPVVATQDLQGDAIKYVVADADVEAIIALAPMLGADVQVRALPRGLLLRADGGEVFFERSSAAMSRTPQVASSRSLKTKRQDNGLPAPNVSSVEYYGFRGVRAVRGTAIADLPAADRATVESVQSEQPLLRYGHVGVSVDGGETIWGFSPDREAFPELTDSAFIALLKSNTSVPGLLRDDTAVFRRAAKLATDEGWSTDVTSSVQLVEPDKKTAITEQITAMSDSGGSGAGAGHSKRYQFPFEEPRGGSHFESETCRNCATFMEFLGLAVPEASGLLSLYIPALKKWAAMSPVDQRMHTEKK
jgi:hypothetical protein